MTPQVRRVVGAVPANIAEGYGRENSGEYVGFLRIAQGSLEELGTHLILVSRVGLIPNEEIDNLLSECEVVGKMLRALIRSMQKGRE